jgi:hypothetical protein
VLAVDIEALCTSQLPLYQFYASRQTSHVFEKKKLKIHCHLVIYSHETTKTTSKSFKQSFNIYSKHTKEGEIVKKARKTK